MNWLLRVLRRLTLPALAAVALLAMATPNAEAHYGYRSSYGYSYNYGGYRPSSYSYSYQYSAPRYYRSYYSTPSYGYRHCR